MISDATDEVCQRHFQSVGDSDQSTNSLFFGARDWTAYNSNLVVNLGSVEGWHTVLVGLRGLPADAQQTWNQIQLKLVLTPPVLLITNLVYVLDSTANTNGLRAASGGDGKGDGNLPTPFGHVRSLFQTQGQGGGQFVPPPSENSPRDGLRLRSFFK